MIADTVSEGFSGNVWCQHYNLPHGLINTSILRRPILHFANIIKVGVIGRIEFIRSNGLIARALSVRNVQMAR